MSRVPAVHRDKSKANVVAILELLLGKYAGREFERFDFAMKEWMTSVKQKKGQIATVPLPEAVAVPLSNIYQSREVLNEFADQTSHDFSIVHRDMSRAIGKCIGQLVAFVGDARCRLLLLLGCSVLEEKKSFFHWKSSLPSEKASSRPFLQHLGVHLAAFDQLLHPHLTSRFVRAIWQNVVVETLTMCVWAGDSPKISKTTVDAFIECLEEMRLFFSADECPPYVDRECFDSGARSISAYLISSTAATSDLIAAAAGEFSKKKEAVASEPVIRVLYGRAQHTKDSAAKKFVESLPESVLHSLRVESARG